MADKATIYITNNSLVIYRWKGSRLEKQLCLMDVSNAKQPLKEYFQQQGNKPVKVVVDLLEEMNSLESLPHLNARDRGAMIERKKKQLFPGAKLSFSQYKGRGKTERRDDLLLFSAITDDKLINTWLQLLFEIEVNVAGIFSLPILLEGVAEKLPGNTDKLVINVASDNTQGILLRQNYFKDNILVLSRYRQINEESRQDQAKEIETDVNRSQRFVARHFNVNNDNSLSSYFFGSGLGLFEKIDFSSIGLKPTHLPTHSFAKSQGKEIDADCGLAAYVAGMAAKKTQQKTHYNDTKSNFHFRHYLIKKGLTVLSMLLIAFAVIYSIIGFTHIFATHQNTDDTRLQRTELVKKLAHSAEEPSFKGYAPTELANHLKALGAINGNQIKPKVVMRLISSVLERFPTIRLTKLEWGAAKKQDESMGELMPLDPTAEGGSEVTITESIPRLLITLHARFEPFKDDYRYAFHRIEQFSAELESNNLIERVTATKLPVDVSTDNELSGAIRAQKSKAEFILDIQWQR